MSRPHFFRRRVGEQHFVIAGFLAFLLFVFGGVVLALVAVGADVWSGIDCKWNPESPRCTLLAERGGW